MPVDARARLSDRLESRALLAVARAFHSPTPETPAWISRAHICAGGANADHLTTPLEAVTTNVHILDNVAAPTIGYLRPTSAPDPDAAMDVLMPVPAGAIDIGQIRQRQADLGHTLAAILGRLPSISVENAVVQVLAALQRHASALPAHTPDCALCEHTRVCAAAAACLEPDDDGKPLTLLVGDLSGIQNYIFGTATGAGGPARRLRARSAALSLLAEVTGHRLLHLFDLPLTNLLIATAGHLYVLLPSGAETERRLRDARAEISTWLRDTYGGELVLHLAWRDVTPEELAPRDAAHPGCSRALRDLAARLLQAKGTPLQAALQDANGWLEEAFVAPVPPAGSAICASCGRRPARRTTRDDQVCDLCYADYELGAALPDAVALAFYRDLPAGNGVVLPLLPPYAVQALRKGEQPVGAPYLIAPFDRSANSMFGPNEPLLPRYMIARVPRASDGSILDFDTLAERSRRSSQDEKRGAPYLGYLRADVDRLGAIFAAGLRHDDLPGGCDGLVQILMLSRTLDVFMTGVLQHLLSTTFPLIYPVFGGGDDLVLIGPWNDILDLALHVRDVFSRYTGNPQLTLSAGVAIVPPALPVARAAALAGDAETLAKNGEPGPTPRERDSLGLFDQQLAWDDVPALRSAVNVLAATDAGVGNAFLHRLLAYGREQAAYLRGNRNVLRHKMRLAYDVARNVRERPDVSDAVKLWCTQMVESTLTGAPRPDARYLEVVARWAILATRKE